MGDIGVSDARRADARETSGPQRPLAGGGVSAKGTGVARKPTSSFRMVLDTADLRVTKWAMVSKNCG